MGLTSADQATLDVTSTQNTNASIPLAQPPNRVETIKNLEAAFHIALDNPDYLADRFHRYVCETMDKSKWGADPDPMVEAFTLANTKAPPSFYSAFSNSKRGQLLARSRNWMAALIKLRKRDLIAPALDFLLKVPATETEMLQSKMHPIIRILRKGTDEIARKSSLLAEKYHIGQAGPGATSSTPAPAKLSAERKLSPETQDSAKKPSIFALSTHRRPKVEKPQVQLLPDPPVPQLATRPAPANSNAAAATKHFTLSDLRAQIGSNKRASPSTPPEVVEVPAPKKAKSGKRVHWKDDSELVQVRFFETEDLNSHFRSATGAREMEMDEAAVTKRSVETIPWTEPPLIMFDATTFGDLRALMGLSRGGLREAVSPEAQIQQAREAKALADFYDPKTAPPTPKEPTEPPTPESPPTRFPTFKGIAPPKPATPPPMAMPPMAMPPMMPTMGMPMMFPPMGFAPDMMHMFKNQHQKK